MKLLILGHSDHGKTEMAEYLSDEYMLKFDDSSEYACKNVIFPQMNHLYSTWQQCYKDRGNYRLAWKKMIDEYNKKHPARLVCEVMQTSDIYVGLRCVKTVRACHHAGIFDFIIGCYDPRKPLEATMQIDIFKWSNFIIPNAGTLNDYKSNIKKVFDRIDF